MDMKPNPARERRRDARVAPLGRVRATSPGKGPPREGALVDVSARGVRMQWEARQPEEGAALTIEILLDDPSCPKGPPRLVLDGKGQVVWVRDLGEGEIHAGIRFDAPVDLRRTFPEVKIF